MDEEKKKRFKVTIEEKEEGKEAEAVYIQIFDELNVNEVIGKLNRGY